MGLYPLLPENVQIDRDEKGELYYIYSAYTDEKPGEKNKEIYFHRDEILHIPGLGFNGLVGFSPIAMMKNALGTTLAVEKYGSAFFKNGAQPSGVLEHPGILKNPEKIRENWMNVYSGANNAHKIAVLEESMTYKPISLPPEDSQFLSTREFGVEEICRIFRVPPHLVQDLKRSTFNNIEHMGISFIQYTLMPWLVRFEQAIIKDVLVGDEQDEYYPKFNIDGFLRGDYESRMRGYSTAVTNGIFTVNEVRRLENFDPYPPEYGGDNPIINGSYIRLQNASIAYGANRHAEDEKAHAAERREQQNGQEDDRKDEDDPDDPDETDDAGSKGSKAHEERHAQRKAERGMKTRKGR